MDFHRQLETLCPLPACHHWTLRLGDKILFRPRGIHLSGMPHRIRAADERIPAGKTYADPAESDLHPLWPQRLLCGGPSQRNRIKKTKHLADRDM